MKVLIVGGVAGGATAAARLRRLDEKAEIIILERSGFVSYANCGLPYYVGGTITDKKALALQTPESFWARFRIQVRVKQEVTAIDPEQKTITVKRLEDGTIYKEHYDKLILSPGAKPVRPPIPGSQNNHVFTLRTVEDTLAIRNFLENEHPQRAVIVGGGFIGLEIAENLTEAGIKTSIVEMSDQLLAPLDYDMACSVHAYLRTKGISLFLNNSVTEIEQQNEKLLVKLSDGEPQSADFVILAVGVAPDTVLAKEAGLELGLKGAIRVNDKMETSHSDIYAVGDAVEVVQLVTGQPSVIPLAGPANKQGRIAADQICGIDSKFTGSQGSSIVKLFSMTAAATGINEKAAQAAGIVYDKVIAFSASHATYYPGADNMTIKVLFRPDNGKLLGAQIVGFQGVDKRIDVLATAIRCGMEGPKLSQLELSYAPPFSSAKDPVNIVGYMIENVMNGIVRQYHWPEIKELADTNDIVILDTRTPVEFASGHIPGAVNIPVDELRDHLEELDSTKLIYVNCQSGLRSYIACRILSQNGFECKNLAGGYRFYQTILENQTFDSAPAHPCGIKIK